jgi:hypothetical protein
VYARFALLAKGHEFRPLAYFLSWRPLTLIVFAFGAIALTRDSTVTAQETYDPSSAPNVSQVALSNEDIVQNEARLKRLEEELLKTLNGQGASEPVEQPRVGQGQSVKITGIRVPSEKQSSETPEQKKLEPQQRVGSPFEEKIEQPIGGSLKELELHPALRGNNRRTGSDEESNESAVKSDNGLAQRLAISESQVEILSKELDITRTRLKSAESRLQRPASKGAREDTSTFDRGHRTSTESEHRDAPSDAPSWEPPFKGGLPVANPQLPESSYAGPSAGMTGRLNSSAVASIAVERAPLRVGPGQRESTLFMMPRHAHVTIEHRTGEWYRVVTDGGNRGWLPGSVLVFDLGVPSSSTVRISGFRGRNEPLSLRY